MAAKKPEYLPTTPTTLVNLWRLTNQQFKNSKFKQNMKINKHVSRDQGLLLVKLYQIKPEMNWNHKDINKGKNM